VALLDVNALIALAWDSHVHHSAMQTWFRANRKSGWETCPVTEIGFVRVSSNPKVLPSSISTAAACEVLVRMRAVGAHRFLPNDVSITAADFPEIAGHRQLTDALLLTVARRHGTKLVTFDAGAAALSGGSDVELLAA
jgi:toxin-antitoxin system PIN domain toxin